MILGIRRRNNLPPGYLHGERVTRLKADLLKIAGAEEGSVGQYLPVDCEI